MADILELIQTLPTELRERILKEYIKIKLRQRKTLGWDAVDKVIKSAPYCHHFKKITKILNYPDCKICGDIYRCDLCERLVWEGHSIEHYGVDKYFVEIHHNRGLCGALEEYFNENGHYLGN